MHRTPFRWPRGVARICLTGFLCLAGTRALADQDALLDQASALLLQHEAKAAYTLLRPLENARSGQPDYDYLLGLAALESGDVTTAAFAFERCLAVEPKNGPCRVQMARTHLALGERHNAQHELTIIKNSAPPPAVLEMVSTYLGDLDASRRQRQHSLDGYIALGGGYDTNANLATSQTAIAVPLFNNVVLPLSSDGTRKQGGFGQSAAGLDGHYRLNAAWTLLADADVADRVYRNHGDVNYRYENANMGGAYQHGASQLSLKLQQQDYDLDNHLYRRLWGALAQHQYGFSDTSQMTSYFQSSRILYPENMTYNVDRRMVGTMYSMALPIALRPVFFVGIDAGHEFARESANEFNGQHFTGGRLGGTLLLTEALAVNMSYAVERRHYDAESPVFLRTRRDDERDVFLGLIYALGQGFSLRPSYSYSHNNSSIIINSFSRAVSALEIRYDR